MTTLVTILAFENISAFHLSVPCMVFGDAAKAAGIEEFAVEVCSEEAEQIDSVSGFAIQAKGDLARFAQGDILVVPSWPEADIKPSNELQSALCRAHARGALVIGLCIGAYALGYAGLLDGKQATTHWAYVEDFQQRFSQVSTVVDQLYHQQDNILTSAGTAAAIDCCLYVLRQRLGAEVANRVARLMVTAPQRQGGQAQFIQLPVPQAVRDEKLAILLDDIRKDLASSYQIDLLAETMNMSRRTFTRHFRALTGVSFGDWLLGERLRYAQSLLESSNLSIEGVSERSGFATALSLRNHFRQRFGVTPGEWRKAFRS